MTQAQVMWRLREKAENCDTTDGYVEALYHKVVGTKRFMVTKGDKC